MWGPLVRLDLFEDGHDRPAGPGQLRLTGGSPLSSGGVGFRPSASKQFGREDAPF